jgi:hypothetical protein
MIVIILTLFYVHSNIFCLQVVEGKLSADVDDSSRCSGSGYQQQQKQHKTKKKRTFE